MARNKESGDMAGLNREHIGLKYVWKDTKGWSLRSKFRVLKEELRMAFQGAWNGVDEDDSYGARYFNPRDATCIFDIMLFHLSMMDEEYADRVALESHPGLKENSSRYLELVHHLDAQNKEQFMHLFNLFYYQLWL